MLDQSILPGGHPGPWLFAHRGTSTLAPESTTAAFDLAMSANADVLEIDVRISRDGTLIVTHDASLIRTTNAKGLVADYTLQELKTFDAGYHFIDANNDTPWRGAGLTLLSLSELFTAYPNVGINIDIKDAHEQAAQSVATELRKLNDGRWINVGSFHPKTMHAFRSFAPEISTAATQWDVATHYFGRALPGVLRKPILKRAKGRVLQIPEQWFGLPLNTAAFIQHVQSEQRSVMYWTINEASSMRTLLQRGANGLVSDNVLVARTMIDQFSAAKATS